MQKVLVSTLGIVLFSLAVAQAVDIPLRNGKVIEVESYRLTGSYLMVKLSDGRQVGYDVADIDVEALLAAEKEASTEAPVEQVRLRPSIMDATVEEGSEPGATISDEDVEHVTLTDDTEDEDEADEENAEGPPPGFSEGQRVVQENVAIEEARPGVWQISGKVTNRSPVVVSDVRIQIEATPPGGQALPNVNARLADTLAPGQAVRFAETIDCPKRPLIGTRVFYMSPQTPGPAPPAAPGARKFAD